MTLTFRVLAKSLERSRDFQHGGCKAVVLHYKKAPKKVYSCCIVRWLADKLWS